MRDNNTAKKIAEILLHTKAVKLSVQNPFQWSSGWLSPIYCDNRVTLSYPQERTFIKNALATFIKTHFSEADAIAGVATAGIAQGALVADELGLPFLYVRPEPKKHGMKNTVEGRLEKGQRVVLVEDLISTGGSSIKAAQNLKDAGADILAIVATISYGFETAEHNFKNSNILCEVLSDYETLISSALEHKYIQPSEMETLKHWRKSPDTWGK